MAAPPSRLPIRLSSTAQRDLAGVRDYLIEAGSPLAAQRVVARIVAAVSRLSTSPLIGRPVSGGARELATAPPYLIPRPSA